MRGHNVRFQSIIRKNIFELSRLRLLIAVFIIRVYTTQYTRYTRETYGVPQVFVSSYGILYFPIYRLLCLLCISIDFCVCAILRACAYVDLNHRGLNHFDFDKRIQTVCQRGGKIVATPGTRTKGLSFTVRALCKLS